AGAPVPRWYHSAGDILVLPDVGEVLWNAGQIGHAAGHLGEVGNLDLPDVGGMPNIDMPNIDIGNIGDGLQGASNLVGGGLQGASDGFFDLLENAGSIFDALDFDW
ncbi:MAG TPA: hypothetical protein VD789_08130, partial [Thermomicrobiales bacterium]|nr:hypothetical protein [Thermomicrobiales bacterium]